jgi:hypothetical protein
MEETDGRISTVLELTDSTKVVRSEDDDEEAAAAPNKTKATRENMGNK